jgi:hypothetical protein
LEVKDGATILTLTTDYTVVYSNNTNTGTATATVTGAGNYTGTTTATFTIVIPVAQTPVLDPSAPPTAGDTIKPGETATLAVAVESPTDAGTLTYQWYAAPDDASPIPGADEDTYTPPTDEAGTTWYYAVVTNTLPGGETTALVTPAVPVTVVAPPAAAIGGLSLPPLEGEGTKDDPFTGDVIISANPNTETLTPADIHTGDATDEVTFYTDPGCTQPVSAVDLYPGETATVYVAVKVNSVTYYYALTFTRPTPSTPPAILRSITLPSVDGAATNPPAGIHRVSSGRDFVFTLTPTGIGTRNSAPPVVRTNRADTPDDVLVTPNADGTYTVRVYAIRSDITLNIDLTTANTDVAGDRVWSSGHTLYIRHARRRSAHLQHRRPAGKSAAVHGGRNRTDHVAERIVYRSDERKDGQGNH